MFPAEPRLKRKRRITRICLVSVLLYAALCAGGCAFQRRLIYFPTKLGPDSAGKLADREGFVLAELDEVISMKFGRRLFDSHKGPKTFEVVPRARHNDIPVRSPAWWRDAFLFLQRN